MRFVESSAQIIEEKDPYKKIEIAGRTCYKSEDRITEESASKFCNSLISRKHFAMTEHAVFLFAVTRNLYYDLIELEDRRYINLTRTLVGYDSVDKINSSVDDYNFVLKRTLPYRYLVSGNARAINELGNPFLLGALSEVYPELVWSTKLPIEDHFKKSAVLIREGIQYFGDHISQREIDKHTYVTFKFTTDRGVSHEIVRHRPSSYGQESTRYCNYSGDKFGNELTFVYPHDYQEFPETAKDIIVSVFNKIECAYNALIDCGLSPQQARVILPNGLKTEIVMTTNHEEYRHFFDLRALGTTGAPHPDMKELACKAKDKYDRCV